MSSPLTKNSLRMGAQANQGRTKGRTKGTVPWSVPWSVAEKSPMGTKVCTWGSFLFMIEGTRHLRPVSYMA